MNVINWYKVTGTSTKELQLYSKNNKMKSKVKPNSLDLNVLMTIWRTNKAAVHVMACLTVIYI